MTKLPGPVVARRGRMLANIGVAAYMLLLAPLATGQETQQVDRIVEAAVNALCYSVYWGGNFGYGGDYRQGVPIPFRLVVSGDAFYMSVKPILFSGPQRQPFEKRLVGTHHRGQPIVVSGSAYEWDAVFADSKPIEGHVTIPRDCTPRYAAWSPLKERVMATVVSTMELRLKTEAKGPVPREVELLIADFNVEYPSTYVLVERPKQQLFMLTLHNPQDYGSDEYERSGDYPLTHIVIQSRHAELLQKIRKHAIKRRIVLAR
jgi:hypothetical protein